MILNRVLLQALNLISARQLTTIQQILNQRQGVLNLRVHQAPHAAATLYQLGQRHDALGVLRQARALLAQEHQRLVQRHAFQARLLGLLVTRNQHDTGQLVAAVLGVDHVQAGLNRVLLFLRCIRVDNHRQRLRVGGHETFIRNNRSLIRQVRQLRAQETRGRGLAATRNAHQGQGSLRLGVTDNRRMKHHAATHQLLDHRNGDAARQVLQALLHAIHAQRANLHERAHQGLGYVQNRGVRYGVHQQHLVVVRNRLIRLVRGLKKFGVQRLPGTLKTLDKSLRLVNQVDGNLRARQAQNNRKQIHNNPSNE